MEGVSAVAGPVLGGILTDKLSWNWCFYINIPCGIITVILLAIFFENPKKTSSPLLSWKQIIVKLDLLGTALLVPAVTILMLALQWGGSRYGWGDARIIVLICVSVILLAGFAFQQWKKGDNATLPGRVFANRSLLAGFWFSFCNGSALSVIEYYVGTFSFLLQNHNLLITSQSIDANIFSSGKGCLRHPLWCSLYPFCNWTFRLCHPRRLWYIFLRILRAFHDSHLSPHSRRRRSTHHRNDKHAFRPPDSVPGLSWFCRRYRFSGSSISCVHYICCGRSTAGYSGDSLRAKFRPGFFRSRCSDHF